MDKVEFLRATPLFRDLADDELRHMVSVLKVATFEEHEEIFDEGEEADAAYIVVEGEVQLTKRIALDLDKSVFVAGPGDVFGEMGMLEREPRSATARATVRSVAVWFGAELLVDLTKDHPAIAAKVLVALGRLLSARLRHTTNLYSAATMWGLEISGASRLHFHDLIHDGRRLRFDTRSGRRYEGQLVRVEKESHDLTIETVEGQLIVVPYHAVDAIHLGATEDLISGPGAPRGDAPHPAEEA